jgi:hypothetical protein
MRRRPTLVTGGHTIGKIREARREGKLEAEFTGRDLVKIGIPEGTAWTFLYKHCIDRGKGYEAFHKYFRKNLDSTYSLLDEQT